MEAPKILATFCWWTNLAPRLRQTCSEGRRPTWQLRNLFCWPVATGDYNSCRERTAARAANSHGQEQMNEHTVSSCSFHKHTAKFHPVWLTAKAVPYHPRTGPRAAMLNIYPFSFNSSSFCLGICQSAWVSRNYLEPVLTSAR